MQASLTSIFQLYLMMLFLIDAQQGTLEPEESDTNQRGSPDLNNIRCNGISTHMLPCTGAYVFTGWKTMIYMVTVSLMETQRASLSVLLSQRGNSNRYILLWCRDSRTLFLQVHTYLMLATVQSYAQPVKFLPLSVTLINL